MFDIGEGAFSGRFLCQHAPHVERHQSLRRRAHGDPCRAPKEAATRHHRGQHVSIVSKLFLGHRRAVCRRSLARVKQVRSGT